MEEQLKIAPGDGDKSNNNLSTNTGVEALQKLSAEVLQDEDKVINNGEITNNDGSVVETLDIAFHDKPGIIKDHSIAGSNRADYYEARSQGKSDSEEELDLIRKQSSETSNE